MDILCIVALCFSWGDVNFIQNEQWQGHLLQETTTHYLIDFSKNDHLCKKTSYSKVLVEKDRCVKLE